MVPENGTVLAKGMIIAASRLKTSQAKSKIMILLTDGEPSPHDSPIDQAIQIARQLGIRVYTIGVGGFQGGYINDPHFGLVQQDSSLNRELLQKIAQKTGGRYFEAKKQHELRLIYDQIDQLEKTDYESTVFRSYYDIFIPFVWLLIVILCIELISSTFIWFAL
jgi:Ca-activated chloride channel homolog